MSFRRCAALLPFVILTAVAQEPPRPVTVATAERGPVVSTLELTGTVTARRRAMLSARIGGLVSSMKVDAGDVVEEGELLMELDDELARLASEGAESVI